MVCYVAIDWNADLMLTVFNYDTLGLLLHAVALMLRMHAYNSSFLLTLCTMLHNMSRLLRELIASFSFHFDILSPRMARKVSLNGQLDLFLQIFFFLVRDLEHDGWMIRWWRCLMVLFFV